MQNLRDLNALCKTMDPSRLTTMANVSTVPMDSQHNYISDVVSYNHYFGCVNATLIVDHSDTEKVYH